MKILDRIAIAIMDTVYSIGIAIMNTLDRIGIPVLIFLGEK